jgi:hypothetical protein
MLKHVLVLTAILSATSSQAMDHCYGQDSHGRQRRFILTEGEATDTKTGLIWMRCGLGTDWRSSRCDVASSSFSLSEANRRAEKLGSGWRVPSGPELQTLIDRTCGKPVVDTVVFPDVRPDPDGAAAYWTTNPVDMAGLYHFFDFMDGSSEAHSGGFPLNVRLVRSGPLRPGGN